MSLRGYDAWVTREPAWMDDAEHEARHCSTCGKFLPDKPYGRKTVNEDAWCDGKPHVTTIRYDDGTHEGLLAIIGEEKRGETYDYALSPLCGTREGGDGKGCTELQQELATSFIEEWEHEPHWTPTPNSYTVYLYRCANGHVTEEIEV